MCTLPTGTILTRVHKSHYDAVDFNPVASDVVFGGGRFDATQLDAYDYLYTGEHDATAVAETLLRDVDPDDHGYRFLPKKLWKGRQVSRLRTTADLQLVTLRTGADLGAIGADSRLVTCDASEYPRSRGWAHWIRRIAPAAAGLAWLSKREPGTTAYVFFGDRCPATPFVPEPGPLTDVCQFDDVDGWIWLREHLQKYRVSIRR